MHIQEWLMENDKNFAKLTEEFGIESKFHSELPLVKLVYSQIDSPKLHPITMECRGLVLNTETLEIEARCFKRFFNYGEALEITENFNWNNFFSDEKVDGSLIIVFWNAIIKDWIITTKGSFADQQICENGPTWESLVRDLLGDDIYKMSPSYTYIFELCSLYNKVVREYREPVLYFLCAIHTKTGVEVYSENVNDSDKIKYPKQFNFKNIEEIVEFLQRMEETDPTFEGCVLRDNTGLRLKIKSKTYLALHRLKGNGNVFLTKNLIPFIMSGETDELLAYFPEVKNIVDDLEKEINIHWNSLYNTWNIAKDITDQKEFAITITKKYNTPFSGILFTMKKNSMIGDVEELKKMWRSSSDNIIKYLKESYVS